ncbi:MAG: F0F1 ATP synthase subunit delta [Gammaproteobacteria bacterium]|nr:F0F1 ATP synthase subunit delta [Gammaproteobacteria bacterium]MBU6509415.1 F0F1 ATP synthase subunit delta [Gammaproteobacteria bacterium]MDE1983777.1 F0F1 ATP synthase subunit delta [Gammaproteobacteria bacterium]MDE2107754.1 F0F1 ATP synthase subunit delta [Gammaproteobacteria bacterium]MDE2459936.1 F0F1 ATP synthase subunit delta [Gammaproteobacteria bacterium]
MAEALTLARPYAKAVFELAHAQHNAERWSRLLALLTTLVGNREAKVMLGDPRVPAEVRAEILLDLCAKTGHKPDQQERNFMRLLAENRRLPLLPEIAAEFASLREQAEGLMEVEMRAAVPVDKTEQERIRKALESKFGRQVKLNCVTDKSLIGGAVLRAGDLVIDGSVRDKLSRLTVAMIQ